MDASVNKTTGEKAPDGETSGAFSRSRAHSAILEWLEEQLRTGSLEVGDKLPSERALAEQFGIARTSVREATRILDAMGILHTATGSGRSSGAIIVSEPATAFTLAMRMHAATRTFAVTDLVRTRILLESEAARSAARASEALNNDSDFIGVGSEPLAAATAVLGGTGEVLSDSAARTALAERRAAVLARAEKIVTKLDAPALPPLEFHALDQAFHRSLAELGNNSVLNTLLASLSGATINYVSTTVAKRGDWDSIRATLNDQHRGILAATRAADGDLAANRIKDHILWFYDRVRETGAI